jgi:hypothetical protein
MTLQEQFNAINKGTGNKEQFLKHARNLFPQYLTKHLDYNTSINVLKTKQIISEQTNVVTKGFDIYDWKKILAEEVKAEEKETSKEVKSKQDAYDATDVKNADNINGNEIWKGYYVEMKDPANADKTGDELKKIVVKNLSKDPLYYTKNGEFGVKGLGYTDEAPGLGKNTQPTSKNASILGGRDEVNSDSDVVKNSLIGLIKKNVKDTLSSSEAKTSMPKKVKEMSVTPQNSKGVKKMDMPGKEKRMKLKEGLSLAELLAEVTEEIVDETSLNENSPIGGGSFFDQEDLNDAWREIEDEVIEDEGYNDEDLKDSNVDNKLYKITSDRFLTKYGKTFSDFAQDLHSKDSNNFGDFDYDTRDKEAEHDFGPDDLDPAGGYGPRSHMEEADVVRTGKGGVPLISKGDFDPKKQDKKSKIPFYAFLPKEVITKINNRFPGSIQIISKDNNLAMFISQMFYIALAGITRGRYSQDIERKKTELTSYISEIIPSFVRGLIKKNVSTAPTKIKETPMHYVDSKLIPTESKTKQISGEGNDNISIDNAKSKAMLDLTEKAKGGEIKILDTRKQKSKSTGNFRCIIMAEVQTQDGYLIPLLGDDTSSQLFQSPWEPMAKNRFTMIYIVRNLKTGQDFEFKTPEKAIEYIGKKGETPTGTPIPLKAIYKVRDNSQGITKEKDKEFDNFEEADKYFNDKTEENSLNEEMNNFIDYEYSDPELIQWAEDEGMEELIVLNPEGGLENRDELLSALTGIENVGEKDYETYDYRKTNFTDFGSGNDLLKESKLRSIISKLIREELN